MKYYKFSPEKMHNISRGELFGEVVNKLIRDYDCKPLVAFSDTIKMPEVIKDFCRSAEYCIDTTFFCPCEHPGIFFSSASAEKISEFDENVILLNLNTECSAKKLYCLADKALKNRKKELLVISLTDDGGFEIAVKEDSNDKLAVNILSVFCEAIGQIVTVELIFDNLF